MGRCSVMEMTRANELWSFWTLVMYTASSFLMSIICPPTLMGIVLLADGIDGTAAHITT